MAFHGFKKISAKMKSDDDDVLRQAEESIKRLEGAGYGKTPPSPAPSRKPMPTQEDYEESEKSQRFRSRMRKFLGK